MKLPLSRFASYPSPGGGGRIQWPGQAGFTGALIWSAPRVSVAPLRANSGLYRPGGPAAPHSPTA